jgi:DNA polymerase-1
VEPPEGSELKKDGFFSVDEETLKSIKHSNNQTRILVKSLLQRAGLEKLLSTYYQGFRKIKEKYDWQDNLLHGTYHQCRVITGRLSSAAPNLQNLPDEMQQFIMSRYETSNH